MVVVAPWRCMIIKKSLSFVFIYSRIPQNSRVIPCEMRATLVHGTLITAKFFAQFPQCNRNICAFKEQQVNGKSAGASLFNQNTNVLEIWNDSIFRETRDHDNVVWLVNVERALRVVYAPQWLQNAVRV